MEQTVTLEWSDLAKAWIAEHGSLAKMIIYDLTAADSSDIAYFGNGATGITPKSKEA